MFFRHHSLYVIAALGLFFPLLGCTNMHKSYGTPLPESTEILHKGGSHYRDVLSVLGPPTQLSAMGDGMVFLYEQTDISERQVGISIDYDWLRLLKFALGSARVHRRVAVMLFDSQGILESREDKEWVDELGGGGSIQFVMAFISVVDTEDLEVTPYQHRWGAQILNKSQFDLLNAPSSLETGQSGVELLGTPTGAGQRTLELNTSSALLP